MINSVLIIDPQKDFCNKDGSLYVPNAECDIHRINKILKKRIKDINKIHVTMDEHHYYSIFHNVWYRGEARTSVPPFTMITAQDLEVGKYSVANIDYEERTLEYAKKLEISGRYPLIAWPPHCIMGTQGASLVPDIVNVLKEWSNYHFKSISYTLKGQSPWTENYSAIMAEVPDRTDMRTLPNLKLIRSLEMSEEIWVMGEASSHCVANTIRDLISQSIHKDTIKKIVIVKDCMSPVTGFENLQEEFFKEMHDKGAQIVSSDNLL